MKNIGLTVDETLMVMSDLLSFKRAEQVDAELEKETPIKTIFEKLFSGDQHQLVPNLKFFSDE